MMLARREAVRSLLLKATLLSSSVILSGFLPPYARAQVVCTGTSSGDCTVGPGGRVSAVGNGTDGADSHDTNDQGQPGTSGLTLSLTNPSAGQTAIGASADGGNGGHGYDADDWDSASRGGNGGSGGAITITNSGAITTLAPASYSAISVTAVGGTGGTGGAANNSNGGQPGGNAGSGGAVTITNSGVIVVSGTSASGIFATAAGGTGGIGGYSPNGYYHYSRVSSPGGAGGSISITNSAAITTEQSRSDGILIVTSGGSGGPGAGVGAPNNSYAQSTGGAGGGAGGAASLAAGTVSFRTPITIDEAAASVVNSATITTLAANSTAIGVVAIGGTGGNNGYGSTQTGGAGGNGGTAYVLNTGAIHVTGDGSNGIAVTVAGGVGGVGGYHTDPYGGNGGNGGYGGAATIISQSGTPITTAGTGATGIFASAAGGAGSVAGFGDGYSASGGDGGKAGSVFIRQSGDITTTGPNSAAIYASAAGGVAGDPADHTVYSGGGAGGAGGIANVTANGTFSTSGANSSAIILNATGGAGNEGNNGGNGADGGTATLDVTGQIIVSGSGSNGISVLVAGGHGGFAGTDESGNQGAGGAGGNGGTVNVTSHADITASGAGAAGIFLYAAGGAVGSSAQLIDARNAGTGGSATLRSYGTIAMTGTVQNNGIVINTTGGIVCVPEQYCGPSAGGAGGAATAFVYGSVSTAGAQGSAAIAIASTGAGGGFGSFYSSTEPVGSGGAGGAINVTVAPLAATPLPLVISTVGNYSAGIALNADGGNGGVGSVLDFGDHAGAGGAGGDGGAVTLSISGDGVQILTRGSGSPGISVSSVAGNGGTSAYSDDNFVDPWLPGGNGGNAGIVTISSSALIFTSGNYSPGISAVGGGGSGGLAGYGIDATGGTGGSGATTGQAISVTNSGTIVTLGRESSGIVISSTGGNGGGNLGNGGTSGPGGVGGDVEVLNSGSIVTAGELSHGVFASSVGGGGGAASNISETGFLIVVEGGAGGSGAAGGDTTISNSDTITTLGSSSNGILAFSSGGGGGAGGSVSATTVGTAIVPSISVTIGGKGGSGAKGGDVSVTNNNGADITTFGTDSAAIRAFSVGGAGGFGGQSDASIYKAALGTLPTFSVGVNIAGSGGSGGNGGDITLNNLGTIVTLGDQSPGIVAESVGGGGGDGGNAMTRDYVLATGSSTSIGVTMGGSGGSGGNGGDITFNNNSNVSNAVSVTTSGFASDAIELLSFGGGGGNGGVGTSRFVAYLPGGAALDFLPLALSESAALTLAIGGDGAGGGNGGNMNTVENDYALTTYGSNSRGISALSVGGGGGVAAAGTASASQKMTINVAVGGSGGAGGDGGAITVINGESGTITTSGDGSHGIAIQSIGGGGGSAGTATADIDGSALLAGAQLGTQALLDLALHSILPNTAKLLDAELGPSAAVTESFGGSGGAGGNGGAISVTNDGQITTGASGGSGGDFALGIFAQSLGGGGGSGGAAISSGSRMFNAQSAMGGNGGAYGTGSAVTVDSTGAITTHGDLAMGVLAQSIGGGGGVGGLAPAQAMVLFDLPIRIGGTIADSASSSGAVTVSTQQVSTFGNESHGVVAQSIGGGGGLFFINQADDMATPPVYSDALGAALDPAVLAQAQIDFAIMRATSSGSINLVLGGSQRSSSQGSGDGSGGAVSVTNSGSITTAGPDALGILAQSIGGGGGFFVDGSGVDVAVMTASGTLGNTSSGSVKQTGGGVDVTLATSSTIATTGAGATAIVAQSIGGGGGYTGALNAVGVSYENFLTPGSGYEMTVGANTAGGNVSIASEGAATITTTGANAHGIIAQSLSGGGGLVADALGIIIPTGSGQSRGPGQNVDGLTPGTVSINFTGTLTTTGAGSVAIFAQDGTQQTSGAIDRTLSTRTYGDIGVVIGPNSTVTGGSGGVYAITLDGGATNSITLGDNVVLTSLSGLAISSPWGTNVLTNGGTIIGDIDLGSGTPSGATATFTNQPGAIYRSNQTGTVNLGSGGTLSNQGMIDVAGVGTIGTLALTGVFGQTVSGVYLADVDGSGAGSSDVISATEVGSTVSGAVKVNVMNAIGPSDSFTILTQSATSPANSMQAATAALEFESASNSGIQASWIPSTTTNALSIRPDLDFAPAGLPLDANAKAYADHLQATWNTGGSERLDRVYAELFNLPSTTAYQTALGTASPVSLAAGPLSQMAIARDRLGSVQSCPEFDDAGGTGTLLVQRECAWGKFGVTRTEYTPSNFTAYTLDTTSYSAGMQTEIAQDWFLGVAGAYMTDGYSSGTGFSSSSGQGMSATAVLKHEMGQWLVSGALNLGYGWYDADRWTAVGSERYLSQSSYNVFTAGARLRADYEIPFKDWYLKPYGQIDLIYGSTPGYDEGGHGSLYDLSVAGSDNFSVAIGPHLEVGGRVDLGEGSTLRPYASAGVTWFSNSAWQVAASLQGAPAGAGTFSTTVDMPDVLANLALGLQWSTKRGIDFRVNYEANLGDSFTSQSGMARVSVNF